jgi:regulator of cell morphogenesis and NO signaling
MNVTAEKTLREVALENPAATRIFESLHLDYCCGGGQTLRQACEDARLPLAEIVGSLESAGRNAAPPERDWNVEPLTDLMTHIRETHHRYTREEIQRLRALLDKVYGVHGARHPEVGNLRAIFRQLAEELGTHLMKEEMVLFPYIERLEESIVAGEPPLPAPFGTMRNPVSMMLREHDDAGQALRDLRRISGGYNAPDDACISFRTLYGALVDFEADLHRHIHLENNILFPRAIEMEGSRG